MIKIKHFITKYDWEGMNYPSGKDGWKKCFKTNLTIPLNFCMLKSTKIYPAYVSKHNSNREIKLFT